MYDQLSRLVVFFVFRLAVLFWIFVWLIVFVLDFRLADCFCFGFLFRFAFVFVCWSCFIIMQWENEFQ